MPDIPAYLLIVRERSLSMGQYLMTWIHYRGHTL